MQSPEIQVNSPGPHGVAGHPFSSSPSEQSAASSQTLINSSSYNISKNEKFLAVQFFWRELDFDPKNIRVAARMRLNC